MWNESKIWCGIDVGLKGGISFINEANECVGAPLPVVDKDLDFREITRLFKFYNPDYICIEQVHAVANGSRKSAFQFGRMYGEVLAMAHTTEAKLTLVLPKTWQKEIYGKPSSDKTKGEKFCKETYPDTPIIMPRCKNFHDGITDAICICHYGKINTSSTS